MHDKVRFFYGDGPAQQFQAGNKIGKFYSSVGCQTHSSRYQEIAYSFRSSHVTLTDRQKFLMEGEAWKHTQFKPKTELNARGVPFKAKKKGGFAREVDRSSSNFPPLAGSTQLKDLGLEQYEVFPTEPLHDLKGHFGNLIKKAIKTGSSNVKNTIQNIENTVLNKSGLLTIVGCYSNIPQLVHTLNYSVQPLKFLKCFMLRTLNDQY